MIVDYNHSIPALGIKHFSMRLAEFDRYTDSNVAHKGENTETQWIKHTLASHNNCCYCPFECFHTLPEEAPDSRVLCGSITHHLVRSTHSPSALSFSSACFPLCFIYSTLFNNISFCSLSSGSLKWCPRAQSGPLHYNCINWSLQMISVWQCAAFLCGLFQCHFIMFTQLFLLYKGLINILILWEGKIQDPVISRPTHIFPLCNS